MIGGPGADVVASERRDDPAAWIALADQGLFVQPADGVAVRCNGSIVEGSRWIEPGDEIGIGSRRIAVERGGGRTVIRVADGPRRSRRSPELRPPTAPRAAPDGRIAPAAYRPRTVGTLERPRRFGVPGPAKIATSISLLALAAIALFVFTARSVEISIEPAADAWSVAGDWPDVSLGDRLLLHQGEWRLEASLAGYEPLDVAFTVGEAPHQRFSFAMDRLPGVLEISTRPSTGVEIEIDGEPVGVAPLDPVELSTGTHTVTARADRYGEVTVSVDVEGGGERQSVTLELDPRWAAVTLTSEPPGADVSIDGDDVGATPSTIDLIEGEHRAVFRLAGFRPASTTFTVEAGQPLAVPPVELVPAPGRVTLVSVPKATVAVDDVFRGESPLELELEPNRPYEVTFTEPGYQTLTTSVTVAPAERRSLEVALEPELGQVEVVGAPAGSTLVVDGATLEGSPVRTLELTTVPHTIEVTKDGFAPFRVTVTPRPGLPQRVEVTLLTVEDAKTAGLPPRIQAPDGTELVLVEELGRLSMGAPRREPGRRANETRREVVLTNPFYIATTETTNAKFRRFDAGHDSGLIAEASLDVDELPVVRVSWEQAARYCNWLSREEGLPLFYREEGSRLVPAEPPNTGYRLPTEAEWAWVARYPHGQGPRKYAWGSELPVAPGASNLGDQSAARILRGSVSGYLDGYPVTSVPGSFPANPVGLFDLGGNVAEWIHDVYDVTAPSSRAIETDPLGAISGDYHVIRGPSWMSTTVTDLRLSARRFGENGQPDVGFRVARFAVAPAPTPEGATP